MVQLNLFACYAATNRTYCATIRLRFLFNTSFDEALCHGLSNFSTANESNFMHFQTVYKKIQNKKTTHKTSDHSIFQLNSPHQKKNTLYATTHIKRDLCYSAVEVK